MALREYEVHSEDNKKSSVTSILVKNLGNKKVDVKSRA